MLSKLRLLTLPVMACLVACFSPTPKPSMDEYTESHPATLRFLDFAIKAKTSASYDALIPEFYTLPTQKRIAKLLGWQHFIYSAAYRTLKDGHCDNIQLKPAGGRIQIDCIGTTIIQSMILGDRVEPVHLRVYMVQQQDHWYFDRSGYVYTNSSSLPVTYGRAGIKFKSVLEQ